MVLLGHLLYHFWVREELPSKTLLFPHAKGDTIPVSCQNYTSPYKVWHSNKGLNENNMNLHSLSISLCQTGHLLVPKCELCCCTILQGPVAIHSDLSKHSLSSTCDCSTHFLSFMLQSMYIRVKRTKTTYFITCEPTETTLNIKEKLHNLIDQPVNDQRLILLGTGEILEDSKSLADQKVLFLVIFQSIELYIYIYILFCEYRWFSFHFPYSWYSLGFQVENDAVVALTLRKGRALKFGSVCFISVVFLMHIFLLGLLIGNVEADCLIKWKGYLVALDVI